MFQSQITIFNNLNKLVNNYIFLLMENPFLQFFSSKDFHLDIQRIKALSPFLELDSSKFSNSESKIFKYSFSLSELV